jgi:site-specific DNA-methyltransferase (adenine-specific)
MSQLDIHYGDNLQVLRGFEDASFDLVYIDPPFNTGKVQARTQLKTERSSDGDRIGFQGQRYRTTRLGTQSFVDKFDDFLDFLEPRFVEARRLLKPTGSFFLHIDFREVHYCKILLDRIFGRDCFMNEIIWSYDYGARATRRWSPKHDNILWYVMDQNSYTFRYEDIERIPYMAPELVGEEKAARGKTPTDVWWNTIVSPNGKEKTGYPTQKPLAILNRIIQVHSNPRDRVLDFFAGSGTTGEAAVRSGRSAVLVDQNVGAMQVMAKRLAFAKPKWFGYEPEAHAAAEPDLFSGAERSA